MKTNILRLLPVLLLGRCQSHRHDHFISQRPVQKTEPLLDISNTGGLTQGNPHLCHDRSDGR